MKRLEATDRAILTLAFPALGTLAAEPLYRLVDTAIVGRLGTSELGGVAVAITVLSFVTAGSNFLAYGTTERVARQIGSGQHAAASGVGVQALWLALIIGLVTLPVLVCAAPTLSAVIGADDQVLAAAHQYLRISALGIPFVLVGLAAQGVQRGAAEYRTPLVVLIVANVANAALELVFVFGFDLGVAGAAWSTVIAQAGAGVALVVMVRPRLVLSPSRRPAWSQMVPLLSAGRHLVIRIGSILAVFTGATSLAAHIDDSTLAAHQIVMTMLLFMALSLDALAIPAQTLVADTLGRRDQLDRDELDAEPSLAHVVRRVVVLSSATAVAAGLLLAAAAPLLATAFTTSGAVASRATAGLVLLAVLLVPGGIAFAYDGVLIGAGDYRFLGRSMLGSVVFVIPLAVAVITWPAVGIVGIWSALTLWMLLRALINHLRARTLLAAPRRPPTARRVQA